MLDAVGRARFKSSPVRVLAELVTSMDSPGGGWGGLAELVTSPVLGGGIGRACYKSSPGGHSL